MTLTRALVIALVLVLTLLGGFAAYVLQTYEAVRQEQEDAKLQELIGSKPLPPEEAAQVIRRAIFRAARDRGEAAAAKSYGKSLDEVRAIVAEGNRDGWQ